jgi:hypothetical protein
MITLSLLIAACFSLVSPQLALAQHTALMQLYDALGSATVFEKVFFFFIFSIFFSFSLFQVVLLRCFRASRRMPRALAVI